MEISDDLGQRHITLPPPRWSRRQRFVLRLISVAILVALGVGLLETLPEGLSMVLLGLFVLAGDLMLWEFSEYAVGAMRRLRPNTRLTLNQASLNAKRAQRQMSVSLADITTISADASGIRLRAEPGETRAIPADLTEGEARRLARMLSHHAARCRQRCAPHPTPQALVELQHRARPTTTIHRGLS